LPRRNIKLADRLDGCNLRRHTRRRGNHSNLEDRDVVTKVWVVRKGSSVEAIAYTGGDAPAGTSAVLEDAHEHKIVGRDILVLLPAGIEDTVQVDLLLAGYSVAAIRHPPRKER
jgi:hypothetical protein